MKKLAIITLVISLLFSFSCCGENKKNIENIEYEEIELYYIDSAIESNLARAQEKYLGMYVLVEAEVESVPAKDKFVVKSGFYGDAWCTVNDKELQKMVLTLNKGDKVLIKGKITNLGGAYDASILVHDIDFILSWFNKISLKEKDWQNPQKASKIFRGFCYAYVDGKLKIVEHK